MKGSVLIIDDNPLDLVVFSAAFEKYGFEPITLNDSAKSLDMAIEHKPSFIVLDLYMPDKDGFEVCAMLKTHPATKNIPVMFVTSSDNLEDATRSLHMGIIDYFHKPVSIDRLIQQVVKHDIVNKMAAILQPMNNEMLSFCEKYKDGI